MSSINDRLRCFLETKGVRQNDFSQKIHSTQQYVSALLNGNRNIGTNLANRIMDEFPDLNKVWFLTGEGNMLKDSSVSVKGINNVVGDNNINVGNSNVVTKNSDVKVGVTDNDQIKELTQIVKTAQDQQTKLMEQLSESQKQVSNLIEIISNKLK